MQFISISRRRTESFADSEFTARAEAEMQQARKLYSEGFIRQIWGRADVPGACIVWEAANEEEAREKINSLPLYHAGMIEFSLMPLKPYPGFSPR